MADLGIVGENEFVERKEDAEVIKTFGIQQVPFVIGYT